MAPYHEEAPPLSADEADLLPPLCAAYWLTSACAKVPRDAAEVEGCERMVHFMRRWLDGAADLRRMGV